MPFVNNMSGKFGFGHPTVNTRGSIEFNVASVTSQYLEISLNATIGTSTTTIEFWFYSTSAATQQRILSTTSTTAAAGDFIAWLPGGNVLMGDGASPLNNSLSPTLNTWHHIAWVGTSGTSQSLYYDGNRVATGGSYNFNDTTLYIGGRQINTLFFRGYLSNLRYVRGTAVYSGTSYTVPIEPLYPIPGTELLLTTPYGSNYLQDSSPNNYTIITHGIPDDPTASTLNPFS